jgi:hypothetical protein
MDQEESLQHEQMSMSVYHAVQIRELIIQKGAEMLYDKFLDSILEPHELSTVVGSVRQVVHSFFRERDNGENFNSIKENWNENLEEEPEHPIICAWANGNIGVEKTVVFGFGEDESEGSIKKTATRSVTSYLRRTKVLSTTKKSFKEFKPKAKPLEDPNKLHPRILKEREIEQVKHQEENRMSPFPVYDLDTQIERLRKKVEIDSKRKKLEDDLKKKKRKLNRDNAGNTGGVHVNIGNKPFTTDNEGKPLLIKNIKTNNLPNHQANHVTEISIDNKH